MHKLLYRVLPFLAWRNFYSAATFRGDLLAGLTGAVAFAVATIPALRDLFYVMQGNALVGVKPPETARQSEATPSGAGLSSQPRTPAAIRCSGCGSVYAIRT